MRKKQTIEIDLGISGVPAECPDVRTFEFTQEDEAVALSEGFFLPDSPRDLLNGVKLADQAASRSFIHSGYALLKAKKLLPHGQFLLFLEQEGYPRQRAHELMVIGKFCTRATPEQRKQMCFFGKAKAALLASADPEVIENLLEEPDECLNGLSVRQLRDRIRALESAVDKEKARADTAEQKASSAENRARLLTHRMDQQNDTPFQPATVQRRALCIAHEERVEINLNTLRQDFEQEVEEGHFTEADERITAIWYAACLIAAKACHLVDFIRGVAPDLPDEITLAHAFSPEETQRWLTQRHLIHTEENAFRAAKQLEAGGELPKRGRGRPRKTGEQQ